MLFLLIAHPGYQTLTKVLSYSVEYLLQAIENGQADCRNVWVIGCFPRRSERNELAERIGAEMIHMDADYKACIERAGNDKQRNITLRRAAVDKYFEQLEV